MAVQTIIAQATPSGRGAISIIRLSGEDAPTLLTKLFKPFGKEKMQHGQLTLGTVSADGIKDKVMAVVFYAPKSYTGENVAELQCHGSPEIVSRILKAFVAAGARIAEPGEFTKRAFFAGKVSLDEAEAISDLINAQSASQINAAYDAMQGCVNQEITSIYNDILSVVGAFDAAIDYPEEDVEEQSKSEVKQTLSDVESKLNALAESYNDGAKMRRGVKVAIVGLPNAGKSSLLNRLLGRDRAIVTDIPGTTRDTIEESYEYKGMLFDIVDTAGLRETKDEVEREGVRRSETAALGADVVVRVTDPTSNSVLPDLETKGKIIDVSSKSDLIKSTGGLAVSSKTGDGIDKLKQLIYDNAFDKNISAGGATITDARHFGLINGALYEISEAVSGIDVAPIDCTLASLKNALVFLGGITGSTATDDVITEIFSKFCVGK